MYNNNNLRQPINNFNEFKFYSVTFKEKFYQIKYLGSNLKLRLEFMQHESCFEIFERRKMSTKARSSNDSSGSGVTNYTTIEKSV